MKPNEIEELSFELIDKEAGQHRFSADEWHIVQRMIHTSADFEYKENVRFHPDAIAAGIHAISSGKSIITDTKMAMAGMRKKELETFGTRVSCFINHPNVIKQSMESGCTRSSAAVDFAIPLIDECIYVVGNAPTALFRLIELIKEKKVKPALIIGLPVGFVNAAESKSALINMNFPFISNLGRKGGSNVAASVVNALAKMAVLKQKDTQPNSITPCSLLPAPSPSTGTLYGIGVGPGDPELMPAKSIRILKTVDMVFAAASTKNKYSLSVSIAKRYIPETTPVVILPFPMTKDKELTRKAWQEHADTIIQALEKGKNAAFLTLGDSLTYSTFGYILKSIQKKAPHIPIETIPGITSYQAAAARLNLPLVEGEESLMITSGVNGGNHLRGLFNKPDNIIFLKAYRNIKDISMALEEAGIIENSIGISNCGMPDEEIISNVKEMCDREPGYWTLIIAKHNHEIKSSSKG